MVRKASRPGYPAAPPTSPGGLAGCARFLSHASLFDTLLMSRSRNPPMLVQGRLGVTSPFEGSPTPAEPPLRHHAPAAPARYVCTSFDLRSRNATIGDVSGGYGEWALPRSDGLFGEGRPRENLSVRCAPNAGSRSTCHVSASNIKTSNYCPLLYVSMLHSTGTDHET